MSPICRFRVGSPEYNPPLISSDQGEVFTRNTLQYPFLTLPSGFIGFWNSRSGFWTRPCDFFIKKSEIFEKKLKTASETVVGISKTNFSQSGHDLKGFSCGKMRTMKNQGFSLKNNEDGF